MSATLLRYDTGPPLPAGGPLALAKAPKDRSRITTAQQQQGKKKYAPRRTEAISEQSREDLRLAQLWSIVSDPTASEDAREAALGDIFLEFSPE